jgi:hypothetical protein
VIPDEGVTPPGPIETKLAHRWKMDEASGNRADLIDLLTLIESGGTINNTAGIDGNAGLFTASNRSLNAALPLWGTKTPFSVCAWVKWNGTANPVNLYIICGQWAVSKVMWQLSRLGNNFNFSWSYDGDHVQQVDKSPGSILANTWYLLAAYYDGNNNQIGLSVNGSAFATLSVNTGGMFQFVQNFNVPAAHGTWGAYMHRGAIDHISIWLDYILTEADVASLYAEFVP